MVFKQAVIEYSFKHEPADKIFIVGRRNTTARCVLWQIVLIVHTVTLTGTPRQKLNLSAICGAETRMRVWWYFG